MPCVREWKRSSSGRASAGAICSTSASPPAPCTAVIQACSRLSPMSRSRRGIPVAMHLAGSQEEADFIRYGSSPFGVHVSEHEQGKLASAYPPWLPAGTSPVSYVSNWGILDVPGILAIHCVQVDDRDIGILREKDVHIGYCPRINAKLGMGSAPLEKFWAAGLPLAWAPTLPRQSTRRT